MADKTTSTASTSRSGKSKEKVEKVPADEMPASADEQVVDIQDTESGHVEHLVEQTQTDGSVKTFDPPAEQQTEPPGVIAGETAAETAVKRLPSGEHAHDRDIGHEHRGPILLDTSDDDSTPNDVEKV